MSQSPNHIVNNNTNTEIDSSSSVIDNSSSKADAASNNNTSEVVDDDFEDVTDIKSQSDIKPVIKSEYTDILDDEDDDDEDDDGDFTETYVKKSDDDDKVTIEDVDIPLVKAEDDTDTLDETKSIVKKDEDEDDEEEEEEEEEEDDDDDDDDDEEDEDDEDDTVRRKKKKTAGNRFLDVEAEVDDDEEDEEDEDDLVLRQEFLADDQTTENAENEASRSHRKLDRSREKLAEQDAQVLADQFKARYGRSSSSRYMGSSQNISQRLLLPSIDDPLIWGVRVRNGKEKELVRQIYARMVNMKDTQEVFSVFQRDNFTGYIYIEARRMDAVNHILANLPGIYNNVGKVLVPIEEYPDLLRPGRSQESTLKPGSYVRIKTGRYKGDLGIVDNLAETDMEVRVKLVPRLDYGRSSNNTVIDPVTGKKKSINYNSSKIRPPQRLFSDIEAQQYDYQHLTTAKKDRNYFIYRNEEYINGFLYKDIKITQLQIQNIKPTLHELTLFDSNNDTDGIDLHSIASTLKIDDSKQVTFQPNDRVEIISGEQSKMKGKVLTIADAKIARILLEGNENSLKLNNTVVEVPTTSLRKIFLQGDHVTIINGVHTNESGLIVDVTDNQVTLVSDQTKKDITVFPNYLVRSVDSSTTASKVGRFELHQMVNLSSNKIGMIIKVEKEIFTILCTDGRVLNLEPKNIMSVLSINKMTEKTTDRNGLEIKVGDVVRESNGEKRQGNILHIYKSYLFLHSKNVYENTGIFVTDSNSVQTIANKGSIASSFKVPDRNPNRMMEPPNLATINQSRFGGRDITISQHVSVRKGPYKGKKGIIKDANGDVARVEMHNPAKIIPISKSDLLFELRPGNYVPHEQFLENFRGKNHHSNRSRPFPPSGPTGPNGSFNNQRMPYNNKYPPNNGMNSITSTGGKTPSWSSGNAGGKTPGWDATGGKTPSWSSAGAGGKTPGWDATGGKTPSWSSAGAGGKTPAWSSAGSGGKTPSWSSSNTAGGKTPSWSSNRSNNRWGNDGGRSEYANGGGSTWGGASVYKNSGNGGADADADWGVTPTVGDWDAPTPVKKEEDM